MKTEYLPLIPIGLLGLLTVFIIYKMIVTQIRGHRIGFLCKHCGRIINADGELMGGADEIRYDSDRICLNCQKKGGRIEVDF